MKITTHRQKHHTLLTLLIICWKGPQIVSDMDAVIETEQHMTEETEL